MATFGSAAVPNIVCKICSDLLTDPRDLDCGHTFCLACLQDGDKDKCQECDMRTVPERAKLKKLRCNYEKSELVRQEILRRIADTKVNDTSKNAKKHKGVVCSMCNKKDFTGVRYICGVCSDYNLCEDCERNPSGEEHDKTHIFLKLKRVLHETVPSGPLLIEGAIEMGKAMDFTRDDHQVFESVSDSQFRITSRVSCDRCAKVGKGYVKGDCYYCGYCTDYMLCSFCEKRSTIIHDPLHIFLKVKHTVNKNIDSARNVSLLKNRLN